MSPHYLPVEDSDRARYLRLLAQTPDPILAVVALDCSPSMNSIFGETTRFKAAKWAQEDYLKILRSSPLAKRILFSLVLFDGKGKVQVPETPLNKVSDDPVGTETPKLLGSTDYYEALMEAQVPIWGNSYAVRPAHLSEGFPEALLTWIKELARGFEEEKATHPLPTVPCPTKLYLIADGEQTGRWSEEACVALAGRLKAAGVHISAQGIGDPVKFGLLRRMVSNLETDFGTHQTPESLRKAFEHLAVSLIRGAG